jgi:hypothetical protein
MRTRTILSISSLLATLSGVSFAATTKAPEIPTSNPSPQPGNILETTNTQQHKIENLRKVCKGNETWISFSIFGGSNCETLVDLLYFAIKNLYETDMLETILRNISSSELEKLAVGEKNPFEFALINNSKNIFEIFRKDADESAKKILNDLRASVIIRTEALQVAAKNGYIDCIQALDGWTNIIKNISPESLNDSPGNLAHLANYFLKFLLDRGNQDDENGFETLAKIAPTDVLNQALNSKEVSEDLKSEIKNIIAKRNKENASKNATVVAAVQQVPNQGAQPYPVKIENQTEGIVPPVQSNQKPQEIANPPAKKNETQTKKENQVGKRKTKNVNTNRAAVQGDGSVGTQGAAVNGVASVGANKAVVKSDGAVVKTEGGVVETEGEVVKTEGAEVKTEGAVVKSDGAVVKGDAPVKTDDGTDATKPKEEESKGNTDMVVIVAITIGTVALVGATAFFLVRRRMNAAKTAV